MFSGNCAIKRFQSHALNAARCSSTTFFGVGWRFGAGMERVCALIPAKLMSPALIAVPILKVHRFLIPGVSPALSVCLRSFAQELYGHVQIQSAVHVRTLERGG